MQLNSQLPKSKSGGKVSLHIEEQDDLWCLYTLIQEGDKLKGPTRRKINEVTASEKSRTKSIRVVLMIEVKKSEYYPSQQGELRVSGINLTEGLVTLGAHHTLQLEPGLDISLSKDSWDDLSLNLLREASTNYSHSDLCILLIDHGICNFYALTRQSAKNIYTIRGFSKASQRVKFFESILVGIQTKYNLSSVKCIIIGGPGNVKKDFHTWLKETKLELKFNLSICMICDTTSIQRQSIDEALLDPIIQKASSHLRYVEQAVAIESLMKSIHHDDHMSCYGYDKVVLASQLQGIKTLLISDELIRNSTREKREAYSSIIKRANDTKSQVLYFSAQHGSGQSKTFALSS